MADSASETITIQAPIDRVLATDPAVTSAVTRVGKTADGGAGA